MLPGARAFRVAMQWWNHLLHSWARDSNNNREVAGGTNCWSLRSITRSHDPICMEFKSCLLRFVQVDVSMSHGGCDLLTVPGLGPGVAVVSDAYRCLRGGVDLTSPSIKRNLNISKGVRY